MTDGRATSNRVTVVLRIVVMPTKVCPGPYLEMFARRQRLGWDTWGDEALEHVEIGGWAHE